MDPNAKWQEVLQALAAKDYSDALWHAEELEEWIGKGGFLPDNVNADVVLAVKLFAAPRAIF